jgi:hypothetical protein
LAWFYPDLLVKGPDPDVYQNVTGTTLDKDLFTLIFMLPLMVSRVIFVVPAAVLRIRIRIHMFLGLLDPDPLDRGMDPDPDPALDPDPFIIMQK